MDQAVLIFDESLRISSTNVVDEGFDSPSFVPGPYPKSGWIYMY